MIGFLGEKAVTLPSGGEEIYATCVPEEVCGQCNAKVAAEFKKKGDWCKEHDRPDSQCFIHHPELKDKFAARYRAKYGKEPPPIEDEEKKDDKSKKEDKKG